MITYTRKHKIPFQIDEEDYESVSQYSWHITGRYLATHTRKYLDEIHFIGKSLYLQEFLLGKAPSGLEWDHINRDKSDYRRKNFRAVRHIDNTHNQGILSTNISGYPGVKLTSGGRYYAGIYGKEFGGIRLGIFDTFEEAKLARMAAEVRYWGRNY